MTPTQPFPQYECKTCGCTPCQSRSFCRMCREADKRLADKRAAAEQWSGR